MQPQVARLQVLIRQMRRRLEFVEASHFWALAQVWHRIKQRLGLMLGFDVPSAPPIDYAENIDFAAPYAQWLAAHDPRSADLERLRRSIDFFALKPSIGLIVEHVDDDRGASAVEGLERQIYPAWTLLFAGEPGKRDNDLSVRLNAALQASTDDYVVVVDPRVVLGPDALFETALAIAADPSIDVLYSDHDMLRDGVRVDPHFKPDWSPETLLSRMYLGPLVFYRRALALEVGGFRQSAGTALHLDLALRVSEATDRIHHVPYVLYHVSADALGDHMPEASDDAVHVIGDALERRGEAGSVRPLPQVENGFLVRYRLAEHRRVSIVLPTRDNPGDLEQCLVSIFERSTYPNFEVLIVDNGSKRPDTLDLFDAWLRREPQRLQLMRTNIPFNFSKINNLAVEQTDGDVLLFLNDDTEVLTPDWIEAMTEQAIRAPIGAVGARLLYRDGSVQHSGVVVGIRGVAGHAHRFWPGDDPGYHGALQTITNYEAVTAACMMMRRDVFGRVGGFDPELANEFNDIDLCLRVREAGYRIVYLPHVVLYHAESKSRGVPNSVTKTARQIRERRLMEKRWNISHYRDPYYSPNLTLEAEDFSVRL